LKTWRRRNSVTRKSVDSRGVPDERLKMREDVIDQEDALQIFAISVGENYKASSTGVVQPNAETRRR